MSATATSAAVPGSYSVEVDQLATAHKLQSISYGAPATLGGTGTLQQAGTGTLVLGGRDGLDAGQGRTVERAAMVTALRRIRSELGVSPTRQVPLLMQHGDAEDRLDGGRQLAHGILRERLAGQGGH